MRSRIDAAIDVLVTDPVWRLDPVQHLNGDGDTIEQEQARIRQNMQQLDRTGDLYTRYVKKFGEQENQIETLREQIQTLVAEQARQQQSLDSFLSGLSLD